MNIDLRKDLQLHNKYELSLIDSRTGTEKQRAYAYNVVLDSAWEAFCGGRASVDINMFNGIALGTGSGTPASTDTSLFTETFKYKEIMTQVSMSEAYPTCTYVYRCSIPATSSYVGSFTELGVVCLKEYDTASNYIIWTHAMLEDSEGNPITIVKTDLDILTVTVTIYVTFGTSDSSWHWYTPGPLNRICQMFRVASGAPKLNADDIYLFHCTTVNLLTTGCIGSITTPAYVGPGTATSSTKLVNVASKRLETTAGNDNYFNGLVLGMHSNSSYRSWLGGLIYPNSTVFPNQTITGMRVGTGDGTTTHFDIPIEAFVASTDVVKVAGVTKVRNTDYTIDNLNESLTALDQLAPSNFAEPVSGVELDINKSTNGLYASDGLYTAGCDCVPFTHYVTVPYKAALKSDSPLVFKVSNCAPSNSVGSIVAAPLNIYKTVSQAYYKKVYTPYNSILLYEDRMHAALPSISGSSTDLVSCIRSIAEDIPVNPTSYCPINTADTLVTILKINWDNRYTTNKDYSNIHFVHRYDYTTYYMYVTPLTGSIKYFVYLTQGTNDPYSDFFGGADLGWRVISGTITVDGTTWTYGYAIAEGSSSLLTISIVSENSFCMPSFITADGNLLGGCSIVISGGSSSSGPWTTLHTISLSNLTLLSSGYYGIADAGQTLATEVSYDYYKVALDTTGATNTELQGRVVYVALPNGYTLSAASPALVLGRTGAGINFVTAPAQDAVITLDAAIDRPFKNSNFVIDASMTLQF